MMEIIIKPKLRTNRLGGVDVPSAEVLKRMHDSQYILHAAGGKLTHIPVEKALLPHSDDMSPQGTHVDVGPDGTVYVKQSQVLCKSTDGGRTWTSRSLMGMEGLPGGHWRVLRNGTFIGVDCSTGPETRDPAVVWVSQDEGITWTKRAEIPVEMDLPDGRPYTERYTHRGLNRLQDDTLLWTVDIRDTPTTMNGCYTFRSTDGGNTWQGPILMIDWGSEGAAVLTPSGRVFATMRYQRPPLPVRHRGDDAPDGRLRRRQRLQECVCNGFSGQRSNVEAAAHALHGVRSNLWLSRSPEQWDGSCNSRYAIWSRTTWITSDDQPGRR